MKNKIKNTLLSILLVVSSNLYAKSEVIDEGHTYEFAEKDMLVELQERVAEKTPEINEKFEAFKKGAKKRVMKWKPKDMRKLSPATKERIFYPDLTYTLEFDLTDAEGKIIYPKGFQYNIGDYMNIPFETVVIDAEVPSQIEWLKSEGLHKNGSVVILVTDGSPIEMMKEMRRPIYFCSKPLQDRWKLEHTPSRIVQVGNQLRVHEVCVSCEKSEKNKKEKKAL